MKKAFWLLTIVLFVLILAFGLVRLIQNGDAYLIPRTIQRFPIELAIALGVYILTYLRQSELSQEPVRFLSFLSILTFVIIYAAPSVDESNSVRYVGFLMFMTYFFTASTLGLVIPAVMTYLKDDGEIKDKEQRENEVVIDQRSFPRFTRTKPPRYH